MAYALDQPQTFLSFVELLFDFGFQFGVEVRRGLPSSQKVVALL
ncbi:MAG TPA: hypothetical protein VGJ16_04980 [Pirellulales bacterium]